MWVARITQSVCSLITGWQGRDRISVKNEIFRAHPNWPWSPDSLLYYGGTWFLQQVKRSERDDHHPLPPRI